MSAGAAVISYFAGVLLAWLVIRAIKRARRDYFASIALQSVLDLDIRDVKGALPGETVGELIARKAYAIADAMENARKK